MIADINNVEIWGTVITGLFLLGAASIPAWLTYKATKMNKTTVEEIREQVLPGNGTKLWQYAQEARDAAVDAKMLAAKAQFEIRNHQIIFQHQRIDLEPLPDSMGGNDGEA